MFIIVVIPQSFHISNQNITFVVAESPQSVLGLFVPSFIALHCEYSNTRFKLLPCVINNFRNSKPQAMEIKCFVISSVPFCQKWMCAHHIHENQSSYFLICQSMVDEILHLSLLRFSKRIPFHTTIPNGCKDIQCLLSSPSCL